MADNATTQQSSPNANAEIADLRPSKRRRTFSNHNLASAEKKSKGTDSAKRKVVGAVGTALTTTPKSTADATPDGAQKSARRVSRRLRDVKDAGSGAVEKASDVAVQRIEKLQAQRAEEIVDSAYGSKEDSLVEEVAQQDDEDVIMVEQAPGRRPVVSEQSVEYLEIPETPGGEVAVADEGRNGTRSASAAGSRSSSRRKGRTTAAADDDTEEVQRSTSKLPLSKKPAPRRRNGSTRKSIETAENVQNQAVDDTDLVISESDNAEETTSVRIPSSRSKKRPRRYSIESQSTREPTPIRAAAIRAVSATVASPQPKGILTPSKGRKNAQRKSVVFDAEEKQLEEQLGFKDIDQSAKKTRKSARATEVASYAEDEELVVANNTVTESTREADHLLDFDQPFDILQSLEKTGTLPPVEDIEDTAAITAIKARVLSQLTSTIPCSPAPHLSTQQATLTNLLRSTIVSGESNSLLMLGPRGAGKTLLLEHVLKELDTEYSSLFHTVRLNGFFQTDDRLALREIWRQLGRETQAPEDEETTAGPSATTLSYADTLASLLSLLSHPDEMDIDQDEQDGDAIMADVDEPQKTAKSTIIVLDEFDLFTLHPRQTLLYNLFDIAQSRKAPIAVIGCSTRMDVVESLEKRVKSRFSHRWLHVPPVKTLAEMTAVVQGASTVRTLTELDNADEVDSLAELDETEVQRWNDCIKTTFLHSAIITNLLSQTFYTTKSIPDVLAALYTPIATLSLPLHAASKTNKPKPSTSHLKISQPPSAHHTTQPSKQPSPSPSTTSPSSPPSSLPPTRPHSPPSPPPTPTTTSSSAGQNSSALLGARVWRAPRGPRRDCGSGDGACVRVFGRSWLGWGSWLLLGLRRGRARGCWMIGWA